MLRTVRFVLWLKPKSRPLLASSRVGPYRIKFASQLRCRESSLYRKLTLKGHRYDTQHGRSYKLCHVSEGTVTTVWHTKCRAWYKLQAVSRVRGNSDVGMTHNIAQATSCVTCQRKQWRRYDTQHAEHGTSYKLCHVSEGTVTSVWHTTLHKLQAVSRVRGDSDVGMTHNIAQSTAEHTSQLRKNRR
jgi:hypothetical protein